jgi:hypothetical protein
MLQLLVADFSNYVHLASVGACGGILVAWMDHLGFLGNSIPGNHLVSIQFCSTSGIHSWPTCVYRPQGNEAKIQFLQELREVQQNCLGPWLVAGCGLADDGAL